MKKQVYQLILKLRRSVVIAAVLAAGTQMYLSGKVYAREEAKLPPVKIQSEDSPLKRDGKFTSSFSPVVKKVGPSVVKVFTTSKMRMPGALEGRMPRFFPFPPGADEDAPTQRMPKQNGLGSGVIISKDGYILTNNHVVENADEIKVTLPNGADEYTAKVVGTDPKSDIAVLKIDAKDLPAITFADSDKIEVGDVVLAVGNPFGIGQTVTMGMISATGRASMGMEYEDFLQTDAAINPGNSGGALVDAEGRLVGINTAILSRSGGNQGIGFAIPSNMARNIMDSLVTNGRVVRGFMGVHIQDLTPGLAKEFKISKSEGAVVSDVTAKGPAEKAGLKSGDVIVEFDGKPVTDSRHLKLQVAQTAPEKTVPLEVYRDGKKKEMTITLRELPGSENVASTDRESSKSDTLDGVTVGDIGPSERRAGNIPSNVQGALVVKIDEDSTSYEAGLREGDVVLEINRKPVKDAGDAVALSDEAKDGRALLKVWSRGGTRYLAVKEPAKKR